MTVDAIFVQDGEAFTATELALGPWAPGALHGGAPAALLAHLLAERMAGTTLRPARLTYEFLRPVPVGPLFAEITTVRAGRRVTVLDASLRDEERTEFVRARALMVVASEIGPSTSAEDPPPPFPGPDAAAPSDWTGRRRMFATEGMDIHFADGRFGDPGPAIAWFRLAKPLIAGAAILPVTRAVAAGDFGNGIASELTWEEHTFINPDLTLYLEREPVGEWVALESRMRVAPGAVAGAESVLWDERGRIGRAIQSLLVGRRGD